MKISEETFFKEIRKGVLHPVYIFEGEPFLLEEAWKELVKTIETAVGKGLVLKKRLSTREISESELSELFLTRSLGFSKKVLWIYEFKGCSHNLVRMIIKTLERPPSSMYLAISPTGEQKVVRDIFEAAKKSNVPCIKFSTPKAYQLPRWIQNRMNRSGKSISLEGAKYIVEIVGTDLYILDEELEKLSLAVPGENITIEDIYTFVAGSHPSSPFEIMDALASGKPHLAFMKLMEIIETGEQPVAFLGLLARHVRLLWQIKILEKASKNSAEIGSILNLPDFIISRLIEQTRAFSTDQLRIIHKKLYEADVKLKTSSIPPLHVLSSLLLFYRP